MSHMKTEKSLLIIYFIYILFGATIITKIEQPVEEERCRKGWFPKSPPNPGSQTGRRFFDVVRGFPSLK